MRFIIGLLIAIGLIVLVFVLILKSFGSHNTSPNIPQPLTSYSSTNTQVEMTITGPIVNDQNYQSVQVIVGQSQAQINVLQGYLGTVTTTKSYPNNQTAYLYFLSALENAGYTDGTSNARPNSILGLCPFGEHYQLEVNKGSSTVQNYWADSCNDKAETFKGNINSVIQLFTNQIPEYSQITQNITFVQ
ncbi:MAG TPA: hypothetical protein VMR18_04550 [Candidatus Saccharimonadales bacterium]|nr:hypothetical protein [Candidatus Saccharimonadales bacterium]